MAVLALIKGVKLGDPSADWGSLTLENENLHQYFKRANQSPIPHIRVEQHCSMNQSEERNGPGSAEDSQSKTGEEVWQRRDSSQDRDNTDLSSGFKDKCHVKDVDRKYTHRQSSDGGLNSSVYKDANANEHKSPAKRHTTVALPVTHKASLFGNSPSVSPDSPDARKNVQFTFGGSDSGSDNDSSDSSKPKQPRSKDGREARRQRFKKMLQPLRRSHSAASTKDIPAHALFLRNKDGEIAGSEHVPVKKTASAESANTMTDFDDLDSRKKKKVPTATLR